MPIDFIKCETTNSAAFLANDLVRAARLTRELIDLLESLLDRGGHLYDAAAPDFAPLAAAFGIAASDGQAVFDIVNGSYSAITGVDQSAQAIVLKNRIG